MEGKVFTQYINFGYYFFDLEKDMEVCFKIRTVNDNMFTVRGTYNRSRELLSNLEVEAFRGLELSVDELDCGLGETVKLSVKPYGILGFDVSNLTFEADLADAVSIASDGTVTGLEAADSVKITARYGDFEDSLDIRVLHGKKAPVSLSGIEIPEGAILIYSASQNSSKISNWNDVWAGSFASSIVTLEDGSRCRKILTDNCGAFDTNVGKLTVPAGKKYRLVYSVFTDRPMNVKPVIRGSDGVLVPVNSTYQWITVEHYYESEIPMAPYDFTLFQLGFAATKDVKTTIYVDEIYLVEVDAE